MSGIKVITAAARPLTLAELRLHLRLDTVDGAHEDDALILAQLDAAVEYAQHNTGRAIGLQTLELALDAFPACGDIMLPLSPVISITSVKYTDINGTEQTVGSSNYALDDYSLQGRVVPAYAYVWPSTQSVPNAVRVRYVGGTVPSAFTAALKLIVGHLYQNREQGSTIEVKDIPLGVDAMLGTQRVYSKC